MQVDAQVSDYSTVLQSKLVQKGINILEIDTVFIVLSLLIPRTCCYLTFWELGELSLLHDYTLYFIQIWTDRFQQNLLDLSPWEDRFPNFDQQVLEGMQVVEGVNRTRKTLAVPYFAEFGILYYRKDLLEKYGFSSPPATWDQLENMVNNVNNPTNPASLNPNNPNNPNTPRYWSSSKERERHHRNWQALCSRGKHTKVQQNKHCILQQQHQRKQQKKTSVSLLSL